MIEVDLGVEIHVVSIAASVPLTGIYALDEQIGGWEWDRRRVEDSTENRAQYLTTLGGHDVGLQDGTVVDYWQSGTISGCAYVGTIERYVNDYKNWVPQVDRGEYALYYDKRNLYSDFSYTSKFSTVELTSGLMSHTLRSDAQWDSIQVCLFRRDENYNIYKEWSFSYVDEFTGEIDSNTRLSTVDDLGVILTANLAGRKKEFLIQDGKILLNGTYSISKEFTTAGDYSVPPAADAASLVEYLGESQDTGRHALVEYFPLENNTVKVWINSTGTLVELLEVDSLAFADPAVQCYQVDYDLGIISTSGYQAEALLLKTAINDLDESIVVYEDLTTMDTWPDQGVLTIGSEQIAYYEKTRFGFTSLTRGYNSTVAASHVAGAEVAHRRMGASMTGDLYAAYTAIPRVDYEVSSEGYRSANKAPWVDVRPLSNVETTNILQIYPGDISLDSILLETDSQVLSASLFGPVYYGSDVSRLTATALDPHENPIQDIDLTIYIDSGTGYLNGSLTAYTDTTNTLGEIYSFYNHPYDRDDMEKVATTVSQVAGDTTMVVPGLDGTEALEDIWVFQILKHDKIVGTTGLPLLVTGSGAASQPYGFYYIDVDGVVSNTFKNGLLVATVGAVKYYKTITWQENLVDVNNVTYTRIYIDSSITIAVGDMVRLLEPEAVEWDSASLNGSRYILYEYSVNAEHPLTGLPGAYTPVHPDSISGNQITFSGRLLPVPAPTVDTNNLGGYVIMAPGKVSLKASGTDPLSGRLVESNEIRLVLELPNFFTGVDSSGVLPVPTGWKFPTEEFNYGAGLGGANFITINPSATGINQFQLQLEV